MGHGQVMASPAVEEYAHGSGTALQWESTLTGHVVELMNRTRYISAHVDARVSPVI